MELINRENWHSVWCCEVFHHVRVDDDLSVGNCAGNWNIVLHYSLAILKRKDNANTECTKKRTGT